MALAFIWIPLAAVITALVVGSLVLVSVREQRKLDGALLATDFTPSTGRSDLPVAA